MDFSAKSADARFFGDLLVIYELSRCQELKSTVYESILVRNGIDLVHDV